jgi:hypothetical protein
MVAVQAGLLVVSPTPLVIGCAIFTVMAAVYTTVLHLQMR